MYLWKLEINEGVCLTPRTSRTQFNSILIIIYCRIKIKTFLQMVILHLIYTILRNNTGVIFGGNGCSSYVRKREKQSCDRSPILA
jgi:hypothetical protein